MIRYRILGGLLVSLMLVMSFSAVAQEPTEITLWRHTSDRQEELDTSRAQIEAFNASQDQWRIVSEELPQGSYTSAVESAALANNLPCVLDFDQPTVPNFAWSGHIRSLNDYISDDMMNSLRTTAVGTYQGDVYSVGQFDATVALWGRRSVLEENDIRIPEGMNDPWTKEEFDNAVETLAGLDEFDIGIEMFTTYSGEWWPYAFGPLMISFGGNMIDRDSMVSAEGLLNGDAAVAWGEWWQNLYQSGLSNPQGADDQAFIQGRAGLAYIGNWFYPGMEEAWGDDLVIMPPPDLGEGSVVFGGSWQWGISSTCDNPDGAWAFIEFIMQPEQVAAMADATGLIPATNAGAEQSELYGEDSPLSVFVTIADSYGMLRPPTPAYPVISSTFEDAAREIALGGDVQQTLDNAVDNIEQDIRDNDGYGFSMDN